MSISLIVQDTIIAAQFEQKKHMLIVTNTLFVKFIYLLIYWTELSFDTCIHLKQFEIKIEKIWMPLEHGFSLIVVEIIYLYHACI